MTKSEPDIVVYRGRKAVVIVRRDVWCHRELLIRYLDGNRERLCVPAAYCEEYDPDA